MLTKSLRNESERVLLTQKVRLLILISAYEYKKPMQSKDNDLKYFVAANIFSLLVIIILVCRNSLVFFCFVLFSSWLLRRCEKSYAFFILFSLYIFFFGFFRQEFTTTKKATSTSGIRVTVLSGFMDVYGVKTVAIN